MWIVCIDIVYFMFWFFVCMLIWIDILVWFRVRVRGSLFEIIGFVVAFFYRIVLLFCIWVVWFLLFFLVVLLLFLIFWSLCLCFLCFLLCVLLNFVGVVFFACALGNFFCSRVLLGIVCICMIWDDFVWSMDFLLDWLFLVLIVVGVCVDLLCFGLLMLCFCCWFLICVCVCLWMIWWWVCCFVYEVLWFGFGFGCVWCDVRCGVVVGVVCVNCELGCIVIIFCIVYLYVIDCMLFFELLIFDWLLCVCCIWWCVWCDDWFCE